VNTEGIIAGGDILTILVSGLNSEGGRSLDLGTFDTRAMGRGGRSIGTLDDRFPRRILDIGVTERDVEVVAFNILGNVACTVGSVVVVDQFDIDRTTNLSPPVKIEVVGSQSIGSDLFADPFEQFSHPSNPPRWIWNQRIKVNGDKLLGTQGILDSGGTSEREKRS